MKRIKQKTKIEEICCRKQSQLLMAFLLPVVVVGGRLVVPGAGEPKREDGADLRRRRTPSPSGAGGTVGGCPGASLPSENQAAAQTRTPGRYPRSPGRAQRIPGKLAVDPAKPWIR